MVRESLWTGYDYDMICQMEAIDAHETSVGTVHWALVTFRLSFVGFSNSIKVQLLM